MVGPGRKQPNPTFSLPPNHSNQTPFPAKISLILSTPFSIFPIFTPIKVINSVIKYAVFTDKSIRLLGKNQYTSNVESGSTRTEIKH